MGGARPVDERFDELLFLAGYGPVAVARALFVVAPWRGMTGAGAARSDDDRPVAESAAE